MSSVATDLFSKIFKIINPEASNPSLDRIKSRKRPAEEVPPHTRKFRRVTDFPKTYPAVLVEEPSRTYVIPVEKSFQSRFSNSGVFGMSKYSKEPRRLEPNYAQIEYSDDDDQEVIFVTQKVPRGQQQQQSGPSSKAKEKLHLRQSTGAKPKIYMNGGTIDDEDEEEEEINENRRQNDNNRIRLVSKSPPFLTRGALMLSRVPGLHPIDRSQFKQASSNTFRQTTNASPSIMQNGSAEGLLKWGSTNLFDLKSTSNHKLNNLSSSSAKSPMVKTNLNSIVTKTLNLDERLKYFDLLKSCAPDLYNDVPVKQNIPVVRRNANLKISPRQAKRNVSNIPIPAGSSKIAQNTHLRKVSPVTKRNIPIPKAQNANLQKLSKVSASVTKRNIPIATSSRQISNLQKIPLLFSRRNIPIAQTRDSACLPKTNLPRPRETKHIATVTNTRNIPKVTINVIPPVQTFLPSTQKDLISFGHNQARSIQDKGVCSQIRTPSNVSKLISADRNIQKAKLNVPKGTRYIPIEIKDDDEDVLEISDSPKSKAAARSPNTSSKPPDVTPVNTLRNKFLLRPEFQEGWLLNVSKKYDNKEQQRNEDIIQQTESVHGLTQKSRQNELDIQKKLQDVCIASEIIQIDDSSESEVEPCEFPELTSDDKKFIDHVSRNGPEQEVIIEKFNLRITRRDLSTLVGLNWLNDEVINFFMNLLAERSELLHDCGYPSVYAMNTFFVPRLMQSGHAGVRRWTRKNDIFSYDIIPVPVHVGQVHWCMAIIHMKDKTIRYYDSMGTPNQAVLTRLKDYLQEESLDKRKITFSMDDWIIESVRKLPRQMNGSDCGVFSCMFAEYITRNKPITFSQQNMEYFRQKMIFEIAKGKLLT